MVHVKQEPSLLPRLDSPPSLGEETRAASGRQSQVGAGGHAMTQGLQVGAEVKVGREEKRQLLGTRAESRSGEEDERCVNPPCNPHAQLHKELIKKVIVQLELLYLGIFYLKNM